MTIALMTAAYAIVGASTPAEPFQVARSNSTDAATTTTAAIATGGDQAATRTNAITQAICGSRNEPGRPMNARLLSLSSAMSPITDSSIPAVIQRANVVSGQPMTAKKSSVVSGLNAICSQRTRFSAPRIASVLVIQRAAIGQRRTHRLYLDWRGAARFVRAEGDQSEAPSWWSRQRS